MKYLNHSVVSDPIYAGRKLYKKDLEFCPRLFLHAASLSIVNPTSGKREEYSAPLPGELQAVLDESLRKE
jgi:23S rRNA-/tRNA-specific pseudouridylate synthase